MNGDYAIMQTCQERSTISARGKTTGDDDRCTSVLMNEVGGTWAWYPYGWGKFGVRLPQEEAVKIARAILDGAA